MKKEFYRKLVERYLEGTSTEEEDELFFHLVRKGKLTRFLKEATRDEEVDLLSGSGVGQHLISKMWTYGVAAAILILLGGGIVWIKHDKPASLPSTALKTDNVFKNDVKPGGEHAILTLANGSQILLDKAGRGKLANQGGTQVIQTHPGSLSYKAADNPPVSAIIYNTVSTPVGGQYQITLADNTHVWLNALSSIKFPVPFSADSRTVDISGEAYFEVAKDKKRPFQVHVNGINVQVLGTAFNINAYLDEPGTKTTLVQGALKLVKEGKSLLLKPGQEGVAQRGSDLVLDKHPNVEQALAWKNGYFSFEGADIRTVMQQISRWYDVEVRYEGDPGSRSFDGQIGRNLNLSEVLNGLSASNVHFKIDGRILTVLP
jgi:transmembrane sensor